MAIYGVLMTFGAAVALAVLYKHRSYAPLYALKLQFVYCWALLFCNALFVFCALFEDSNFTQGLFLLFLGAPIVVIAAAKSRALDPSVEEMAQPEIHDPANTCSTLSLSTVQNLIYLIQTKDTNKKSYTTLQGIVLLHTTVCTVVDCPLRLYAQHMRQIHQGADTRRFSRQRKTEAKIDKILNIYVNLIFEKTLRGRRTTSKDVNFRIAYVQYLFEVMKTQNLAISELIILEDSVQTLMEEFQIYKLRRRIEEDLNSSNSATGSEADRKAGNEGADFVVAIAFDNAMSHLKECIHKVTDMHVQFWLNLEEDMPDFLRLCEIGLEIVEGIEKIEQTFSKMRKFYKFDQKSVELYLQYAKEVLNDRDSYDYWAKSLQENKDARFHHNEFSSSTLGTTGKFGETEESGCVLVSGKLNNLGQIINANAGMGKLFGFVKSQLIGQMAETLMPAIYRTHHQHMFENLVKNSAGTIRESMTDIAVLGLNRNDYLVPIIKNVKRISSLTEGISFLALIRLDKKLCSSHEALVLLNQDKKVEHITSTCIKLLKMDKKMIADNKIIFSQLCPEPFAEAAHEKFFSGRDKCVATFTYPKVGSQELDVLGRSEEFKLSLGRTEENSRKFYCSVREASFLDARGFGYIVRLTEIIDTQNMPYEVSCFTRNPSMRPKSYFTYEPNDSKFVVVPNSYTGPEHDVYPADRLRSLASPLIPARFTEKQAEKFRKRKIWTEQQLQYMVKHNSKSGLKDLATLEREMQQAEQMKKVADEPEDAIQYLQEEIAARPDYGQGVTTYRLIDGELIKAEDQSTFIKTRQLNWKILKIDDVAEIFPSDTGVDEGRDQSQAAVGIDSKIVFSSRKKMAELLRIKFTPCSIRVLQWAFNLILLSFVVLCIVEYSNTSTMGDMTNLIMRTMLVAHGRYKSIVRSALSTQILFLANNPQATRLTNFFRSSNRTTFSLNEQARISTEVAKVYEGQRLVDLTNIRLTAAHAAYKKNSYASLTYVIPNTTIFKQVKLRYRNKILMIGSALFTIMNQDLKSYRNKTQEADTVLENVHSYFSTETSELMGLYVGDVYSAEDFLQTFLTATTITCGCLLLVGIAVLFPVVSQIHQSQLRLLTFFLCIPATVVGSLGKKCEDFLTVLQDSHDDNDTSPFEDKMSAGELEMLDGSYTERKRRKYKNVGTRVGNFYARFMVIVVVLAGYIAASFYFSYTASGRAKDHADEMRDNMMAASDYILVTNGITDLYGFWNTTSHNVSYEYVKLYYVMLMNSTYAALTSQIALHDLRRDSLSESYNNIYEAIFKQNLCDYSSLYEVANSTCESLARGMVTRGLYDVIVDYIETARDSYNALMGNEKNISFRSSFINSYTYVSLENAALIVIPNSFNYLSEQLLNAHEDMHNLADEIRLTLFICLIGFCVVGYAALWLPFVIVLASEIINAQRMLVIIPTESAHRIKKMEKYVLELYQLDKFGTQDAGDK